MKKKAIVLGTVICLCLIAVAVWFFAESKNISDTGDNKYGRTWLRDIDENKEAGEDADTPSPYTSSDFDENERQTRMDNDPRLAEIKNQPWETKNLDVRTNGNAALFLAATANYDMERLFDPIRWGFPIGDVKENFSTYAGEYVFLDKCTSRGVETVPAGSDLANAVSGGTEFYIVTFTTETGAEACYYLLTDHAKADKSSYGKDEDNLTVFSGWPLGLDSEGRVVIGY